MQHVCKPRTQRAPPRGAYVTKKGEPREKWWPERLLGVGMCDLPPEWWDLEAESWEDSARSILIHTGSATWTGCPQSGGIKVTPLTELRGKDRAQPGEEVWVISGQSVSRGTRGRGNCSLLRAQERRRHLEKAKIFLNVSSSERRNWGGSCRHEKGQNLLLP